MSRVLVVDDEPPQAVSGGGARMIQLLRLLRDDAHDVTFVSYRPWPVSLVVTQNRLEGLGVEVVCRDGDVIGLLRRRGRDFDAVILSRLKPAATLLPAVRSLAPQARVIYDAEHVAYLGLYRLAKLTHDRGVLGAALRGRSKERDVVSGVDAVLAVTREDALEFELLSPRAPTHVVTATHVTPDRTECPDAPRAGIIFAGFLAYSENAFAARRLVEGIWPAITRAIGPVRLDVCGAVAPDWLTEAAKRTPGLSAPGVVVDLDATMRRAAVMVVPMQGGSGVKFKVLHAFARRLPVVATADGLRGIPAVDGVHALKGETDAELATATMRVLREPRLGTALADAAGELYQEEFDIERSRKALRAALEGSRCA